MSRFVRNVISTCIFFGLICLTISCSDGFEDSTCMMMPSCDSGGLGVSQCPSGETCYEVTECGTTILCVEGDCAEEPTCQEGTVAVEMEDCDTTDDCHSVVGCESIVYCKEICEGSHCSDNPLTIPDCPSTDFEVTGLDTAGEGDEVILEGQIQEQANVTRVQPAECAEETPSGLRGRTLVRDDEEDLVDQYVSLRQDEGDAIVCGCSLAEDDECDLLVVDIPIRIKGLYHHSEDQNCQNIPNQNACHQLVVHETCLP